MKGCNTTPPQRERERERVEKSSSRFISAVWEEPTETLVARDATRASRLLCHPERREMFVGEHDAIVIGAGKRAASEIDGGDDVTRISPIQRR